MSCTLTFEILGSLYSINENGEMVPVDSSKKSNTGTITIKNSEVTKETPLDLVWSKIIETLNSNSKQKKQLLDYLKYIKNTQRRLVDADIIKKEGLVPNSKYSRLKTKYEGEKGYTFYDFDDGNPNILLVSKLRLNGENYGDMIVGKDFKGEPLYIVYDTKESINKLNNHLYVKNLIQTKFDGNDERLTKLGVTDNMKSPIKIKNRLIHNLKELLIDYITHSSDYRDNQRVIKYLGAIDNILMDLKDSKFYRYSDSLDQNFSAFLKNKKSKNISSASFYKFLSSNKDTKELVKDLKQNDEKLKDPLFVKDLFNKFLERLKEFKCNVLVKENGNLVINTEFLSLNSVSNITYDTIMNYKSYPTYRGYDIKIAQEENGKTYVIFDKNVVTPNTSIYNKVEVEGDVDLFINTVIKPRINEKINEIPTANNFEYGLYNLDENVVVQTVKFNKLPVSNSVIKAIDIKPIIATLNNSPELSKLRDFKISEDLQSYGIHEDEEGFLPPSKNSTNQVPRKATIEEFYKYISNQITPEQLTELKKVINTGEKVGLFLIVINKLLPNPELRNFKTTNSDQFSAILKAFENVTYKLYYVLESGTLGLYTRNIIPIEKPIVINTEYNRPLPIIGALLNMTDKLSKMFGIKIEVMTSDMMLKHFPDIPVTTTKAFIRNGVIYINGSIATSDDVAHEYIHLFLGMLKAENYDLYIATMEAVDKELDWVRKRIRKSYPNLARTDLNEEAFAVYFGEKISGKNFNSVAEEINNKRNKLLAKEEKIKSNSSLSEDKKNKLIEKCKNEISNLVTGLIGRPITDVASSNLRMICDLISRDMLYDSSKKEFDYSRGTVFRQTSNLISKDIENGKIIEDCN